MNDAKRSDGKRDDLPIHWKSMRDNAFLGAWDLCGRDVVVEIARVDPGTVGHDGNGKKKSRTAILTFKGKNKQLPLNVTNGDAVSKMYGTDVRKWIGQRVTLYPSTTQMAGKTVDCVRVRDRRPDAKAETGDFPEADPAERERMLKAQDEAAGRLPATDAKPAGRDAGELSEAEERRMAEEQARRGS